MNIQRIEKLIGSEKKQILLLEQELAETGSGKLHVRHRKGKVYFREYIGGKQRGVTKQEDRIYKLARKEIVLDCLDKRRKSLETLEEAASRIKALEKTDKVEEVLKRFHMLDKDRIIFSEEQLKWISECESQNPYKREYLRYQTKNGVLTRSKSERFIGDFLSSHGVLYRYEPELIIEGRHVYPDFLVLCPDGHSVIWEHLGMMENSDYFTKAMLKISEYRKIGYTQHRNLICTYEEDLTDLKKLEEILYRFLN